jgi:hypothetical protein
MIEGQRICIDAHAESNQRHVDFQTLSQIGITDPGRCQRLLPRC